MTKPAGIGLNSGAEEDAQDARSSTRERLVPTNDPA